jgi:hypothetical protein
MNHSTKKSRVQKLVTRIFVAGLLAGSVLLGPAARQASAAACTAPSTDYGSATTTLNAPTATTYRVWSRMMVPDTTNKSYFLEFDGANCFNVGGGSISASTWTWIDYAGGNSNSKVQLALTQGSHTVKLIGNAPGVKVDRIIMVSDLTCVPTGLGDNCNVPSDTTAPTVDLTAPAQGASVSGNVQLTATASDNTGVTKVEFYDNSNLIATDTTSPYSATWNSATATNGSHLVTAKAYDAAGNINTDAVTVTVQNGDTQAPTTPANLTATATSYSAVNVTWAASTDNVGVTGYTIIRDSVPIVTLGKVTSYANTGLSANTTYAYQVLAIDAAGNKSAASNKVTVTTQKVADPTPPTPPQAPAATSPTPTQVNLEWKPSTDNIGVVGYDVYRKCNADDKQKVGTSTTTSFGDPNAAAGANCTYDIVAVDASGNDSPTTSVKVTTPKANDNVPGVLGKIIDRKSSKIIAFARAIVRVGKARHIYQADQYGRYAVFDLQKGRYDLSFTFTGYSTHTASVQINNGRLVRDIVLQKKP